MTDIPDSWLAFAIELADAAHAMVAPAGRVRPNAVVKPDRSFVTALDGEIEQRLRGMIERRFPDHGILGEEGDATAIDAEYVWILDPIDGTAPFIAGSPVYGTLIALAHKGTPILGQAMVGRVCLALRGGPRPTVGRSTLWARC